MPLVAPDLVFIIFIAPDPEIVPLLLDPVLVFLAAPHLVIESSATRDFVLVYFMGFHIVVLHR